MCHLRVPGVLILIQQIQKTVISKSKYASQVNATTFSKVSPMFTRAGWIQIICLENSCSGELSSHDCAVETASEDSVIVGIYKLVGLKQFYIVSGSYCGIIPVKHAKQLCMERAYFYCYRTHSKLRPPFLLVRFSYKYGGLIIE